jgi:PilZ domain
VSEVLRTIASRFREYVGNRRRSPRYSVSVSATVCLTDASLAKKNSRVIEIKATTRDVSASGLALVCDVIRVGDKYLAGEDRVLAVILQIPDGTVKLHCSPVRYEQREETEDEPRYLIGLKINEVDAADHLRWQKWLASVAKSSPA